MKGSLRRLIIPATLIVALAGFGCASPPSAEKKAATEAVSAAKAAGAEKYAPGDFAAATDALKAAEDQMTARKYSEAKTAYAKAKEQAGKAATKSQVEQQLAEAGKRWQELEGKVKAAAKKFKAEQKQAWEADAKATAEALQAAKAAAGDDPAAAMDKLAGVVQALEKWEVEVKGLGTSAPKMKTAEKKEQPAVDRLP